MKTEINSIEMIEALKLISDSYNVPANYRRKIKYMGQGAEITGAKGNRLSIRLNGQRRSIFVNPVWKIEY